MEHFHSSGKMPQVMDLLKIVQRELAIRLGHFLMSFAGILSRTVAFDLLNLDSKVKTSEEFVILNSMHVLDCCSGSEACKKRPCPSFRLFPKLIHMSYVHVALVNLHHNSLDSRASQCIQF